jgi:hypothetical protein
VRELGHDNMEAFHNDLVENLSALNVPEGITWPMLVDQSFRKFGCKWWMMNAFDGVEMVELCGSETLDGQTS